MIQARISRRELAASWRVQRRVVGALLLREVLTRYGRHNIGFLWLFLEPMLFTLGIVALWTLALSQHHSHIPIVAFAVTGYSSVLLWRNMPSRCIGGIGPNLALMYHRNVKVIDIFLARLLLEAVGATMSFVVLVLVFYFLGWMELPEDPLMVVGAWLLLAWFGASLAVFLGALAERSDLVEKLWHPAAYLLFPLSGAAFVVDAFSLPVQQFLLWLPMVNGVEMLRDAYFGSSVKAHYDVSYLASWCAALTLLGLSQVRDVSRRVTPE